MQNDMPTAITAGLWVRYVVMTACLGGIEGWKTGEVLVYPIKRRHIRHDQAASGNIVHRLKVGRSTWSVEFVDNGRELLDATGNEHIRINVVETFYVLKCSLKCFGMNLTPIIDRRESARLLLK